MVKARLENTSQSDLCGFYGSPLGQLAVIEVTLPSGLTHALFSGKLLGQRVVVRELRPVLVHVAHVRELLSILTG